jgi:FkbM family methyltransferase
MALLKRLLKHRPPPAAEDRATEEDIHYAYRLILRRDPDPGGLAHYQKLVGEGLTLHQLIRSFFNSDEYRLRLDEESRPTPVDLGGYQVCVLISDTDFGQGIFHAREYEPHVRQAVRDHVREGDVVVDVGANVGAIALLAATLVKASGRVIAIEPNPDNLQLLYRGIVLNRLTNVEVLPYAASNGRTVFSLTGGTSNTHLVSPRAPVEGGYFVQSIALDDLLGGLPRLDFLKMDIEGHEPQAWEGFAKTIARHRPALLVEFNPRCLIDLHQRDPRAFLHQLFALYPRLRVTSAFKDDEVFERAEDLWAYWERRNREVTSQQLLPDRLLHFDLVAPRGMTAFGL